MKSLLNPSAPLRTSPHASPDQVVQFQALVPGFDRLPVEAISRDMLIFQDPLPLEPVSRLVVILPPGEIDPVGLSRRVWQIADSSGLSVLYLADSAGSAQTPELRRQAANLAAMTTSGNVRAAFKMSSGARLDHSLAAVRTEGDLLVCLAEHHVPQRFARRTALGPQLAALTRAPVYMLGGLEIKMTARPWRLVREILAWTAFIGLAAAFFVLEVRIDRLLADPMATILLCITAGAEFFLVWKINSWLR